MSDNEIINTILSGTPDQINTCFRFLYKHHYTKTSRIVIKMGGADEDAADTFQNALLVFFDQVKEKTFRGKSSISTFLYAVCRNLWMKTLAERKKEAAAFATKGEMDDSYFIPIDESYLKVKLTDLIKRLTQNCKAILSAYYFNGLTYDEIATNHDYSNRDSVKIQKFRCLKKLIELVRANRLEMDNLE